jgi:outer membrane protein assembly factor BamD (BamD/ComL family)
VALLRRARTALRDGDARGALALLDEHASRFPGGSLAEDCAAERIQVLCALGRVEDARALSSRFVAAHASSPHAAAVRGSCGLSARR